MNPSPSKSFPFSHSSPMKFWFTSCVCWQLCLKTFKSKCDPDRLHILSLLTIFEMFQMWSSWMAWWMTMTNNKWSSRSHPGYLTIFNCSKCDQPFFLRWSIEIVLCRKIEATIEEWQKWQWERHSDLVIWWHCWQHVTSNHNIDEVELKTMIKFLATCCLGLETEGQLSQRSPTPSPSVSFWSFWIWTWYITA